MKRDRAPSERIRGISCFAKCVYTCQSRLESCNRTKPDLLVLACCAFPFASANIISVIQAKMYSKYIVATATGKRYVIRFWNIILFDSPQLRFTRCTPTPIPDFTLKWKTVSRCRSSLFPFVFLLVFFSTQFRKHTAEKKSTRGSNRVFEKTVTINNASLSAFGVSSFILIKGTYVSSAQRKPSWKLWLAMKT